MQTTEEHEDCISYTANLAASVMHFSTVVHTEIIYHSPLAVAVEVEASVTGVWGSASLTGGIVLISFSSLSYSAICSNSLSTALISEKKTHQKTCLEKSA